MKVAVVKLGNRLTDRETTGIGVGEAMAICAYLKSCGHDVHIFTEIKDMDNPGDEYTWHHSLVDTYKEDINSAADVLLVINGLTDFFGGAERTGMIRNYELLNAFKGKVYYVMCDPEIPLQQIWGSVRGKPWASKFSEQEVLISRTDIEVISQSRDLEYLQTHWNSKPRTVPVAGFKHFPFEVFTATVRESLPARKFPTADLMYGAGSSRGGRRSLGLLSWYYGMPPDICAEIFGKITHDDILHHLKMEEEDIQERLPFFTAAMKYNEFTAKMNYGLATLVIGDPSYEQLDIIPQRAYESALAGVVVFVDAEMDKGRNIHTDAVLREFLYVSTKEELIERLRVLKSDEYLREYIIDAQNKAIKAAVAAAPQILNSILES